MSNVVYKWQLRPFIESLKKYLYFSDDEKTLYCSAESKEKDSSLKRVEKIEVVRADSDPSSNYIVCSRICQQMQIADIVVVDFSSRNANVFYEFGMAVALGKLILPICYSESFYRMVLPEKAVIDKKTEMDKKAEELMHHIGCYPWRKELFESCRV